MKLEDLVSPEIRCLLPPMLGALQSRPHVESSASPLPNTAAMPFYPSLHYRLTHLQKPISKIHLPIQPDAE
jgi:hypothetical protein